ITGPGSQKYRSPGKVDRVSPTARRGPLDNKIIEGVSLDPDRSGLLSGKIPGTDAVDLNIVGGPFGGQVPGQHFESPLGRRVGTYSVPTQFTHHGADVDDLPFPSLDHVLGHELGHDKGAHQVNVHHFSELGHFHGEGWHPSDDPGIVHQDVNLSVFSDDLFHKL